MPAPLLLTFEILGTVAFAISGAMTGMKKNMDIFGVAILGLTIAVVALRYLAVKYRWSLPKSHLYM